MKRKKNEFEELVVSRIFLVRSMKVMLDRDLAELYGVETKVLNQAVKRNMNRFPSDFMFQLNISELSAWKSQIVTSNSVSKGLRKKPHAFTEQGVAMLSSVLNSPIAIDVNIRIIRIFSKVRELVLNQKDLLLKIEEIEKRVTAQDHNQLRQSKEIEAIFITLKSLLNPALPPMKKIGYKRQNET